MDYEERISELENYVKDVRAAIDRINTRLNHFNLPRHDFDSPAYTEALHDLLLKNFPSLGAS